MYIVWEWKIYGIGIKKCILYRNEKYMELGWSNVYCIGIKNI